MTTNDAYSAGLANVRHIRSSASYLCVAARQAWAVSLTPVLGAPLLLGTLSSRWSFMVFGGTNHASGFEHSPVVGERRLRGGDSLCVCKR
jgi:hypothetical protein